MKDGDLALRVGYFAYDSHKGQGSEHRARIEQGLFEQTYKIHEYDLTGEEQLKLIVSEDFVRAALVHFQSMQRSMHDAMAKI